MLGGLFAGAAAEATDRSLKEWQALFDARQAEERRAQLQERQLDIQQAQMEWDKTRLELQQQHELGILDQEMFRQWERDTMNLLGEIQDPARQWDLYRALLDRGSSYAPTARAAIQESLVSSPMAAQEVINNFLDAKPGTVIDLPWLEDNLRALAKFRNMSEAETEEYVKRHLTLAEQRMSEKGEVDELLLDSLRLDNAQAKADIERTEADTQNISQRTLDMATRLGWDAEKHPVELEIMERQAGILATEEAQQQLILGNMPTRFMLENRQLMAQILQQENANELFAATFEDQVRTIAAQADMTVEEARHMLATASARDALVTGNLDHLKAITEHVKAQTETEGYRQELLGVQTDQTRLANQEARIGIVQELVTHGMGDLVAEIAPGLLEGMVGEDQLPELIDALRSIADDRLDAQTKLNAANARIALAQADFEERTLDTRVVLEETKTSQAEVQLDILEMQRDTFLEDREFDQWATRYALRTDRMRAEAYVKSLEAPEMPPGMDPRQRLEVMRLVKDATGWTTREVSKVVVDAHQLDADAKVLEEAVRTGNLAVIQDLSNKYGIDPEMGLAGVAALEGMAAAKREEAINGIHAIFDGGLKFGIEFTPTDLNLKLDDPLFRAALDRYPFFREREHEVDGQVDAAIRKVISASDGDPASALFGNVYGVFDYLTSEESGIPAEALVNAGYSEPADLLGAYEQLSTEYMTAVEAASPLAARYGLDLSNREHRDSLQKAAVSELNYLDQQSEAILRAASAPGQGPFQAAQMLQQLASYHGLDHTHLLTPVGTIDMTRGVGGLRNFLEQIRGNILEAQAGVQILNHF